MPTRIQIVENPDRRALAPTPEAWLAELGAAGASAWLRIPGRDSGRARAVATLVHGNEPSGLRAVHGWLRGGSVPATDVVIWIASLAAALGPPLFGHRALPGIRDLNRCFRAPFSGSPEQELAGEALALIEGARPEALIDLHNNTGHNPAYSVGCRPGPTERALTALFGDFFVHSRLTLGALVEATYERFPSVTIECGRAGDPEADEVARRGLARYLDLEHLDSKSLGQPVRILADPMQVRIRPGVELRIGDGPGDGADLTVSSDIDRHNFEQLEPGTCFGWLGPHAAWPIEARTSEGRDVARDYFRVRGQRLEAARPLIPIMVTTDAKIATSDCLFYIVSAGSD